MTVYGIHRLVALTTVVLASGFATTLPANAATRHSHHSAHHKRPHHQKSGGIPQHNGGDHDADNNGGPSDGDGNV
jgi:hypothetical protein